LKLLQLWLCLLLGQQFLVSSMLQMKNKVQYAGLVHATTPPLDVSPWQASGLASPP
jgi:hypothetical protein